MLVKTFFSFMKRSQLGFMFSCKLWWIAEATCHSRKKGFESGIFSHILMKTWQFVTYWGHGWQLSSVMWEQTFFQRPFQSTDDEYLCIKGRIWVKSNFKEDNIYILQLFLPPSCGALVLMAVMLPLILWLIPCKTEQQKNRSVEILC